MKTKPGQMRHTTVGDARKLGLLPSVTNILGVIDRPELDSWKETQAILAALTLPRNPLEGDDDFAERAAKDAREQVSKAAERGTRVHAAIEELLCFGSVKPHEDVASIFDPFVAWSQVNILDVHFAEQTVVGTGYAGKLDLKCELRNVGPAIIDFKTRRPHNGKFATYPHDGLQLSAYQYTEPNPSAARVSVFINACEAAEPHVHLWERNDDESSFHAFLSAFSLWKFLKNYNPQ